MSKQHPIVTAHLSQHYSNNDDVFMPDEILKHYRPAFNEALYVVDCKHAQLEVLTNNFKQITGIDIDHKNELIPLYEHVSSHDLNRFDAFTLKFVNIGFKIESDIKLSQDDFYSCIYKTHDDRVIIKSARLLYRDSNEQMRYTLGKLTDVTGLVDYKKFSCKFYGPNSKKVYSLLNDIGEVENILSKRELQILILIGEGMSSKEIANSLFISLLTVHTHRKNILMKLETSGSLKAYNKAKDMGLF